MMRSIWTFGFIVDVDLRLVGFEYLLIIRLFELLLMNSAYISHG